MSQREMSEQDTQFMLGKTFDVGRRDAIHIAVAPVVAVTFLAPGEHIGFVEAPERVGRNYVGSPLGIVDPFLQKPVSPGERFWMFLYPNTITSLRHQWTHPAFGAQDAPQTTHISQIDHAAKSREWIAEHAKQLGLTPDVVMEDAEHWLMYQEHKVQQGSERWRDNFNPTEFWHHYEVVTGELVPADEKQSFYCCTC